ncbi:Holliday junction resolvase RuvX [Candidatus Falkowbacteria bacterium CG10_big_fil_rev_8_21_14_0_10_39_11]|uniref:Putative pre-16S rRNA nuclease n=1 Tax=Candidatus Falkowbacteria bacterium CG10_big_fil_rev_8_21_14_0_10_39_11 TaxID=1974565 RepID=A0A2H0V8D9_9BACT|nr:MAG: Holliday junction resolvase RuvX [Candidatus Falkowbacteria bacterium CG10_big_fil_rev_8_21_14_0_10_39_11]
MHYIGLDWGTAKIGIAIGSDETKFASPILTLSYHSLSEIIEKLSELIISEQAEAFVIGHPISLAGEAKREQSFHTFVKEIESLGLPVYFEDERLSTKYAASLAREFKGSKKVSDDEVAAAAILQTYFDKK